MCSRKHSRYLHGKHYLQDFRSLFGNVETDIQQSVDGSLAYSTSSTFYAAAIPAGSVQQKVFIATDATDTVEVSFIWQSV
jgi:hypothetical protein